MPYPQHTNQQFDFTLNGKGFMLVRDPKSNGRSWLRRGTSDLPRRSFYFQEDRYGNQVDEVDHVEFWEDWSGGFGSAYRQAPDDNHYLYAFNFDARYPRQLIHCQQLSLLPNAQYSGSNVNVEYITDVPPVSSPQPAGAGAILVTGRNFVSSFTPTTLLTMASQFMMLNEATGQSAIGRPALFGSYTYIATGTGFYQRDNAGMTYTLNTTMNAQGFGNFRNVMWRRFNNNLLQEVPYGSDPMVGANWSATLNIGNGQQPINDMIERGGALFLGMSDGLYQGDTSGTFYNILPEARDVRHVDNGRDLYAYDGGVIFGGAPGLFWYQPSQYGTSAGDSFEVGPQGVTSGRNPVRGRNRAGTGLGPWSYAGMWTGSQSWILAGGVEASGRGNPYNWHTMQLLPHTAKINRIHFDSITNASGQYTEIPSRMWIATEASFGALTNATAPLYVAPVPRLNQNPLTDLSFTPNYCGSARIDFPFTDWQMPGVYKIFRSLEIYADNLASGAQYANVWAIIDNGSRQYVGQANQSPKSTLYFPGDNGTFMSGIAIQLSIESYTFSSTITPVYRSVVLRGPVTPRSVDVVTAVVHIADGLPDRFGNEMRDGATMISELRSLGDPLQTGRNPVMMQDLAGATQWVRVLPSIEEQEIHQAGDRPLEVAATIRLACLDFTQSTGDPPMLMYPNAVAGQLL